MVLQLHSLFFKHFRQRKSLRYVHSLGLFLLTAVAGKECRDEALFARRITAKIETLGVVEFA